MHNIVAIVHTEGVILFNRYVVLELAYMDVTGVQKNFLIQSPMRYKDAKKCNRYLQMSQEVVMCTSSTYCGQRVYKYREILHFLKHRFRLFDHYFRGDVQFGYKGKSFQQDILKQSSIPRINIEMFGIPAIKTLMEFYPYARKQCFFHKHYHNKCAKHILKLIKMHILKTCNPFLTLWTSRSPLLDAVPSELYFLSGYCNLQECVCP